MWKWYGLLAAEMMIVGFLVGSTLFGLNMMITCLLLRMNRNDAFSSLRIGGYNNLLRFRLTEDGFDMYVVGLERIPRREEWVANNKHDRTKPNPEVPVFAPMRELDPHLVEKVSIRFAPKTDQPVATV